MMPHWTRREFTRNLGMITLFSPFLDLLSSKKAKAAPGDAKYLLIFFTNGTDTSQWAPQGSEGGITTFSRMTEPLAPLRANLTLIDRLDSNGTAGGHAAPGGLTGRNYGAGQLISVDQFVSDGLRANGIRTQIPNVLLGGVPAQSPSTFYRANRALSPISSPTAAFGAIFGGSGDVGGGAAPDAPNEAVVRLTNRKSILDVLKGDIAQLNRELVGSEKQKLDIHLDSIRQLEERIAQQQTSITDTASGAIEPVQCNSAGVANQSQDLLNSQVHLDIAIQAFACDLTRVAAVEFGHHQGAQVNIPEVGTGDWHNDFTHADAAPRNRMVNLERWLSGRFVDAANKLKATPAPDGNGSLFDQTLMIWGRDMGDSVIHDGSNLRFVLSGGAGGYLGRAANGRFINGGGQPHQRLLLNVLEAMGVTNFAGFGNEAAGAARTPLPNIGA
jgi:hypothetical protein